MAMQTEEPSLSERAAEGFEPDAIVMVVYLLLGLSWLKLAA